MKLKKKVLYRFGFYITNDAVLLQVLTNMKTSFSFWLYKELFH